MRRFLVPMLAGLAAVAALLAARSASHWLIYDFIHAAEMRGEFPYEHPLTTFDDVAAHFGDVVEDLEFTEPVWPWYPAAKVVGVISVPTILGAGLITAAACLLWTRRRRPTRSLEPPRPQE